MPDQLKSGQIILGLAIILLGVLFLLNTTGIADTGGAARWIPSIFILLGVWGMVASGFRSVQGPLTLILVAGLIQLALIGALTWAFFSQWWPVILILIGLNMLVGWFGFGRNAWRRASNDDEARLFAFLGDTDAAPVSQAFRAGQVTTILGDAELDLRGAAVADRPARVDVMVLLGDTKVRVPSEWNVRNDALVLLASYKDERRRGETPQADSPDLIISGVAILGDIKVQD